MEINKLKYQVGELEIALKQCREMQAKTHQAPYNDDASTLDGTGAKSNARHLTIHAQNDLALQRGAWQYLTRLACTSRLLYKSRKTKHTR